MVKITKFICMYCEDEFPITELIENTLTPTMLDTYRGRTEDNECNLCWLDNQCEEQREHEGYVWDNDVMDLYNKITMDRKYGK